jgi:hypothetical protein
MKKKAKKSLTFKKYYKLLGGFFIDAAKIIFGSIVVVPIVERKISFHYDGLALFFIGFSCTLLSLLLGLYLSKK